MNRQQRRAFAKANHKAQPYSAFFKTLVGETGKQLDDSNEKWCNRHDLRIYSKTLTPEDKKKIAAITLENRKRTNDEGEVEYFKICPKCYRVFNVTIKPQLSQDKNLGLHHGA